MKLKSITALILLAGCAVMACAQNNEPRRTITVTGEALVMVVPNEATVTIGIETFNASLQKGQDTNTAAGKRLLESIKSLGVEEKFIKTQDLSVDVQYVNSGHPSRGIEGYTLRRMYEITVKDVTKAAVVVNTALMNGANLVSGINYRTTELRKHRDSARAMAVRAAKEKAAALLAELGCKVGKPLTVYEASVGYYGYRRDLGMTQNAMSYVEGNQTSGDLDTDTVPAGQIGIRATVQVVFDIST